jgi:hypothetical protein
VKTLQKLAVPVVLIAAVAGLTACDRPSIPPANSTPPPVSNSTVPPTPSTPKEIAGFDKLQGRWLRPDGGYILHIRTTQPDGRLEAGYFNPQPIHVSHAQASREGTVVKVFVELRDVHYPGCTYHLTYHPAADRLTGHYFQAGIGQTFEVDFIRAPQ